MKKAFKVIDITLIVLLVCCGIAGVVFYFIEPYEMENIFNQIVELCNKPLPIVGVSIALVGYELSKVFAQTSLGKKQIQKLWDMNDLLKNEITVQKEQFETLVETLKIELENAKEIIAKQKEYIDEVAKTIPNKKVNGLVDKYGNKEE